MTIELNKIDVFFLTLIILLVGASLGAYYSDTNWSKDLRNFSENDLRFRFDLSDSQHYYTITQHNFYDVRSDGEKIYSITDTTNITYDEVSQNFTYQYGKIGSTFDKR
jgi:hypothetical protein